MANYRERFWAQVIVRDVSQCWDWLGAIDAGGHGVYKGQRAHRMALFFSGVPTRPRTDVHHTCHNKQCVSPFHLQLLTHADHSRVTRLQNASN